ARRSIALRRWRWGVRCWREAWGGVRWGREARWWVRWWREARRRARRGRECVRRWRKLRRRVRRWPECALRRRRESGAGDRIERLVDLCERSLGVLALRRILLEAGRLPGCRQTLVRIADFALAGSRTHAQHTVRSLQIHRAMLRDATRRIEHRLV